MPVSDFVDLPIEPPSLSSSFDPHARQASSLDDNHLDLLASRLTKAARDVPLDDQRLVLPASPRRPSSSHRHKPSRFFASPSILRQTRLHANLARILAELDQEVARLRQSR